jgi:hypothetical protein
MHGEGILMPESTTINSSGQYLKPTNNRSRRTLIAEMSSPVVEASPIQVFSLTSRRCIAERKEREML